MITHLDLMSCGHTFGRKVACRAAETSSNHEHVHIARFPYTVHKILFYFLTVKISKH